MFLISFIEINEIDRFLAVEITFEFLEKCREDVSIIIRIPVYLSKIRENLFFQNFLKIAQVHGVAHGKEFF